jgi:Flp pilus assembly protein TadD
MIQVGGHSMADRYTYIPLVGLFITIAWGMPGLLSGWRWRQWAPGLAGGFAVTALAFASWTQVGYWRDNFTLFGHALAVSKDNWVAHINLGMSFQQNGRNEEAAFYYSEALRLLPHLAEVRNDLGNIMLLQGRQEEAAYHYREVLRTQPYHTHANTSLGMMLYRQGRPDEAIDHFRRALQGKYQNAEAHYHLGMALQRQGRLEEAIYHYSEALRFRPGDPVIRLLLGKALSSRNQ